MCEQVLDWLLEDVYLWPANRLGQSRRRWVRVSGVALLFVWLPLITLPLILPIVFLMIGTIIEGAWKGPQSQ